MVSLPRFYPILDTGLLDARGMSPEAAGSELLNAGARILQFRHKGHLSRSVFETARRVNGLCQRSGALFVMNDRADIARLLDAALHLGQDDLPPADARRILGPRSLVGFSTHNERQFRNAAAEPVDYLALGPIFQTGSKLNPDPVVGLDEFRRLRSLTALPLVAIGGITRDNARDVIAAGADAIAVIGDLFAGSCNAASIRMRAECWVELLA